jgi:hypothetical protein
MTSDGPSLSRAEVIRGRQRSCAPRRLCEGVRRRQLRARSAMVGKAFMARNEALVSIFYLRGPVLWPVSSYVATLFRRRTAVALQPSGAATGPLASLIGAVGTRRSVRRRVGTGNNSHHSRRAVYTADRLSVYSDVNFSLHFGTRAARANRGHKRFRHAHHSQHPRRCRAPDGRD